VARNRRAAGVAALSMLLLWLVAPMPAVASPDPDSTQQIGIGLVAPAGAPAPDSPAATYIVDQLEPGRQLTRQVRIDNASRQSQQISLYAAGASIENGQFQFADGRTENELSSWTRVSRNVVTLAAHTTAQISATIAVPVSATGGERYAVVWAQVSAPTAAGINESNRVGIRMYVDVAGQTAPSRDFAIGAISADRTSSDRPRVSAVVDNIGSLALDIRGSLKLTDGPSGLQVAPVLINAAVTVGPKQTGRATFDLSAGLPDGPWRATIVLSSADLSHQGQAVLTFPDSGQKVAPLETFPRKESNHRNTLWPIVLGTSGAAALVVTMIYRAYGRRHGRRDTSSICPGNSRE
jgi:hypothetical protein